MAVEVDKIVSDITGVVKDKTYSEKELQADRTKRLEIDNTSRFLLPHVIRPIIAIWSMTIYTFLSIWLMISDKVDPLTILGTTGTILVTVIGFYFNSRKMEKIHAKKAAVETEKMKAAVEIEKIRNKQELKQEKRENRQKNKKLRRDSRANRGSGLQEE